MLGRRDELVINPDDTNSLGNLAQPSSGRRRRSSPSDDSDWTLQLLHKQRQRTVLQFFFIVMLLISALVLGFFMHTSSQSEQQLTREITIMQLDNDKMAQTISRIEDELQRTNATITEEATKRVEAESKLAEIEASLQTEKAARTAAETQRDQQKTEKEQAVQRSRDECSNQVSSTRSQVEQEKQNLQNQARDAQAAAQKAQAELKALQDAPNVAAVTIEGAVAVALSAVPPTNPPSNPPSPAVVASYTPPADLRDRPVTAALTPKARGIVVSFVHEDNISLRGSSATGLPQPNTVQLQNCWESAQAALFTPHGLEWLLIYELWPTDMTSQLKQWRVKNGFVPESDASAESTLWDDSLHGRTFLAPLPDNAPEGAVRTRITFHGVVLALPRYLSLRPELAEQRTWAPRRRLWGPSLLARRAFWVSGLWSLANTIPALQGPDYIMKLALATLWNSAPAINPFEAAANAKCVVAHDGLHAEWIETHEGAVEALRSYAGRYALTPASGSRAWCQSTWPPASPDLKTTPNPTEGPVWFQPSPFVVSLRWMRSVEVQHALTYLYEDESASGYFRVGWGDVPVWPKLVCLHHDVAELNAPDNGVCNLQEQWDIKPIKAP